MTSIAEITVIVDISPAISAVVDASACIKAATAAITQERLADAVEMTVRVTDDQEVHDLNRRFRSVDATTDVLSFATDASGEETTLVLPPDMPRMLGDLVVNYECAVRQADAYGHTLDRELGWLIVHGTLQLLGYAHETEEEARRMRTQEELILSGLGLTRPDS